MPLPLDEQLHLTAAQGFIGLKMYLEANEELEHIDPYCRHLPEVLAVRLEIYHGLEKWELMQAVAKKLALEQPWEWNWMIQWAAANRHVISVEAGKKVILKAIEHYPKVADLHYHLASYECELGDVGGTKECLKRCFDLDPSLKIVVLEDERFKALWDSL